MINMLKIGLITEVLFEQKAVTEVCVYLAGLVGLDVGASDHQRNPDVELVELPFIQRQRELTWTTGRGHTLAVET